MEEFVKEIFVESHKGIKKKFCTRNIAKKKICKKQNNKVLALCMFIKLKLLLW